MTSDPGARADDSAPHTTERVTLDEYHGTVGDHVIYSLHTATYDFALPYAADKDVLDFGCGTGYGSAALAEVARSVVAVDVADDAVRYATAHFTGERLSYQRIEPIQRTPLPFAEDSFDLVVSFQVIEHIDDVAAYLGEVRRVLRPGGTFLCVTPDRTHRLFPRQRPWNEFHVTEYAPDELAQVLRGHFADVELLGMSAAPHIIGHELRRYRKMRLLAYPFTFPGAPEALRLAGIRAAKKVTGGRTAAPATQTFDFGPKDIVVAPGAEPSVNVVAVATGGS